MKSSKAAIVVLVIVAAAVAVLARNRQGDEALADATRVAGAVDAPLEVASRGLEQAESAPAKSPGERSGTAANAASSAIGLQSHVHPFADIPRSRLGLALADDPFDAQSRQDQAWLDRHGYPNALQWSAYSSAPTDELQRAADLGDALARTLLDGRRLAAGDPDALEALLQQGGRGNTFAIELAAGAFAGSGAHADPVMAYALYRLAELRGHHAAALSRESILGAALDSMQRLEAERNALALYASMTSDGQGSIGVPCRADPGPVVP